MSTALSTRARQETISTPRTRRLAVALGLTAALTGGTLVAQAPDAAAAPTSSAVKTAATGDVRLSLSAPKKKMVQGMGSERPTFTVRATSAGKPLTGRATLQVNGRSVSTKKLAGGKASFKPVWGQYRGEGKRKIRVVVDPAKSGVANKATGTVVVQASKAPSKGATVVKVASQYLGTPYVSGGSSPRGFDCSGFTSYVYRKAVGKKLPRSSSAQRHVGHRVSRAAAKPGDLVWTPGHVAIYAGNGKVIEAGNPRVDVVKRRMWQDNPTFIRVI